MGIVVLAQLSQHSAVHKGIVSSAVGQACRWHRRLADSIDSSAPDWEQWLERFRPSLWDSHQENKSRPPRRLAVQGRPIWQARRRVALSPYHRIARATGCASGRSQTQIGTRGTATLYDFHFPLAHARSRFRTGAYSVVATGMVSCNRGNLTDSSRTANANGCNFGQPRPSISRSQRPTDCVPT